MTTIIEIIKEAKQSEETDDIFFHEFGKPFSDQELETLSKSIQLPEDYKILMKTFGPSDFSGPDTNIIFLSIEEIFKNELNSTENLGEVFVFGSDNGGNYYFYDIHNIGKKGVNSIYDVYPGNPKWEHCMYLAPDLTTLLHKILKGDNFT
jgi:hypothetical protein